MQQSTSSSNETTCAGGIKIESVRARLTSVFFMLNQFPVFVYVILFTGFKLNYSIISVEH